MTAELTERQTEILNYIKWAVMTHGMSPTVQEIQRAFGFRSPNAVQTHLSALYKKGVLERRGRSARALRVIDIGPHRNDINGWVGTGSHRSDTYLSDKPTSSTETTPARQLESGVDVFFNARHRVGGEFGGEIHAHSWRLRAVVSTGATSSSAPLDVVREALQEEMSDVEGVTLNELEHFQAKEPTLEQTATWLSAKVRCKLDALGVRLLSTTVWDHPTQYVTTWENGNGHL